MLNLGLIGDIKLLEPYTQKAQEHREIHITGKSSVGTHSRPGSIKLQVPEFNRIELIERSDALLINRFSLLPFHLLCDMVKKSKHIFAVGYPDLKPAELDQLAKLGQEAKTVIQIKNPFYYLPAVQWLANHFKKPAYINVEYFSNEAPDKYTLLQLLLMFKNTAGKLPKKTGGISFRSSAANLSFYNVQLDYGDGTVMNLNFGQSNAMRRFEIKSFMHNHFADLDLINEKYSVNNQPMNSFDSVATDETSAFISTIFQNRKATTDIDTYSVALNTMAMIQEKLDRFISL